MNSCKPPFPCNDESRRAALQPFAAPHNGIEAVEVVPLPDTDPFVQRKLVVHFLGGIPAGLTGKPPTAFGITGGVRIPGSAIQVEDASIVGGELELTVDRAGDFSDYHLTITHPDLDPVYSCCRFNFKVGCPNPFDCQPAPPTPAPQPPGPPIDYQVKDYQSFRRALLDFLPSRLPGFVESNEADLAVTLAELFAYAGDQLSYLQDAVANEASLGTVRQRRSAKRHARLVDYRMHDGLAARTVLFFEVAPGNPPVPINPGVAITTRDSVPSRRICFETDAIVQCFDEHNVIRPHTWLNRDCCLLRGATAMDLAGALPHLGRGQLLLIEEVLAEVTGLDGTPLADPSGHPILVPDAADPARRQIVRLLTVDPLTDPALPAGQQDVTRVTWDPRDALRFDFCLKSDAAGNPATVARANLVPASHGRTVSNEVVDKDEPILAQGPLTWLDPVPASTPALLYPPDIPDPNRAGSTVQLTINGVAWTERESFLDSAVDSPDFVVDTENDGRGSLRFGDGRLGRALPVQPFILASYRVGIGVEGNVGADVLTQGAPLPNGIRSVRNPLPAAGGMDPEPILDVRRDAPEEFKARQYRAVTAVDYAAAAKGIQGVSGAAAIFRWTGSWLTVFVAVDPEGRQDLPPVLEQIVSARLESYRQAGYDFEIVPPTYVPLRIELEICVSFDYFQADVRAAVLEVLSSGRRRDGTTGFFHPDRFSFGDHVYLSRLYAVVQEVAGVRSVRATVFQRLNRPARGELEAGRLEVGLFEVARLDNNPSEPDNGLLILHLTGGK